MRNHSYYVYMMASDRWILYVWVTNNLERRFFEHKEGIFEWFSSKYNCKKLVYCEHFTDINCAIAREKQIKKWRRDKKEFLINETNPDWNDLSKDW